MKAPIVKRARLAGRSGRGCKAVLAVAAMASLTGCIKVNAPDGPIVIDLNINIRQEVVVRLQDDARQLIEREPGVF